MKIRRWTGGFFLLLLLLLFAAPLSAGAATYTWKSVGNGDMQCYKGKTLVKNSWVGIKHLNASGYMDRNTWVEKKVNGVTKKVFVRDDGKWVKNFQAGWQKIKKKYYFYTGTGKMMTGWIKFDDKMYYVDKTTKTRVTGLYSIGGKLYYFAAKGALVTSQEVTYDGTSYIADENGVCLPAAAGGEGETGVAAGTAASSEDMLFFLKFESGSEAYNQTGGDHGNACGAYQFDNRYSLLPFVKFAYAKNSTLCKEFKKFVNIASGTALKSNNKFYKAWHKIYARNPKAFADLQDEFARSEYYDPVEKKLATFGIDLASRPDVVKGAVYSYAIQHGQTTAVNAVRACKLKAGMTDQKFLKKLYQYRMKSFPVYKTRYLAEYNLALVRLNTAAAQGQAA